MTINIKPDPQQILKSAKNILLIDWPNPGVPRALLNAGFKVFGYSPDCYSQAQLVADLPPGIEEKDSFPPRNEGEKGYLIFQKLDRRPDAVDIVNVYRPEEELPGIIKNHVVPSGAKVLWLHPPATSAKAREITAENDIIFIEGTNIAELASKIDLKMESKTTFVPVLSISSGVTDIEFYKRAFGATELWRINNPDGTVHVTAFSINGAVFRLHEESKNGRTLSPHKTGGTTVEIGLTVDDVHAVVATAVAAGAIVINPVKDYEYGYRQGEIKDPLGHYWLIEKLLSQEALDNFVSNA
ncbi:MAG TPA: VOC family protein [Mucilaginibacter sp.]